MNIFIKNSKKKAGLPPGTVIHTGKRKVKQQFCNILQYTTEKFTEKKATNITEVLPYQEQKETTWIDIIGLHDTKSIETLGETYGIHPLTLEDITNTNQRPVMEEYENYIFISCKMFLLQESILDQEHISIIITRNHVLSFQEKPGDVFDSVRERIRTGRWRSKKREADYLGYALLDSIVDSYFVILEQIGEKIEAIEEQLHQKLDQQLVAKIHQLKREMIFLRKAVWPLREVINKLQKSESNLITTPTKHYIADLYDHTIQVIDTIESYRDVIGGLLEYHLSATSNKMNEVMKVLTIFAAIFIPLTFFAGIYGMNFDYIPELSWKYSYFVLWGFFLLVGGGMLLYFKKKDWL